MPLPEDSPEKPKGEAVYDVPPAFQPFDPNENEEPDSVIPVQPTSDGPAQSSDTPGFGGTSGADGDHPDEEDQAPPLPEFDPRHREPFEGLLYLGRLQETFRLYGHKFVIRTLTTEQMAEIALITKPYQGTPAENAVYQAAVVAASVQTVDDEPLPGSVLVDDSGELTKVKYPYVSRKWMPPVREGIYKKCFALEIRVREVLVAMGEASG